jgi:hypothetical protein
MAIEKTVILNVETKEATKNIDLLSRSFEDAYGEIQPLTGRMGELEDQLYELANAGKQGTEEFKILANEVGRMKKTIQQTDAQVDGLAMTTSQKLGGALGGVTSGFELVQGAMGALGAESGAVQEALLKVQSAMAIAQGVQGIKESVPAFKAMGAAGKTALTGIKSGIAATGIGLLLVAVGTIVAYWDDIKEAINGVSSEQEALNAKSAANLEMQQSKLDAIGGQENILKLQGKSEKQILQIKLAQTDQVIKATEAQIKQNEITLKAQISASQRNKDILQGIIRYITAPLTSLLYTIDLIGKAVGKDFGLEKKFSGGLAKLMFDPDKVKEEGEKALAEQRNQLTKLQNDRAGLQLQVQAIDKQDADARASKQKEANDKAIAKQKEANDKKLKDQEEYNEKRKQAEQDLNDELDKISDKWIAKQSKDAEDRKAKRAKDEQDIYDNQIGFQEAAIIKDEENLVAKKNLLDLQKELELQNKELTEGEKAAIEAKYAKQKADLDTAASDKQLALEKERQDARYKAVSDTLQTISSISELFAGKSKEQQRKAFNVQKAVNIATATIDTYKAAVSAYASGSKFSPIFGAVAAAAAVTAGLLNVKKIADTKFDAGGATGGGGGAGTAPNVPNVQAANFNVVGAGGANQLAQLSSNPIKAYVVSGEVSSAQSLDRNIVKNATI